MRQDLKNQFFLQIRPDVQDIQPYRIQMALNSAVAAMGSGLSPVALMVVLAVVLVPAGHFLFLRLLLLLGILVHRWRFRLLLLLIEVLVLLWHVHSPDKVMCDSAEKPVPAAL